MKCKVEFAKRNDGSRQSFRYRFEAETTEALEEAINNQLLSLRKTEPTIIIARKKYTL